MAKAILEFDLNDFDDELAHRRASMALSMASCLWDIRHELLKGLERKYEMNEISEKSEISKENLLVKFYKKISLFGFTLVFFKKSNRKEEYYDILDYLYEGFSDILDSHGIDLDSVIR